MRMVHENMYAKSLIMYIICIYDRKNSSLLFDFLFQMQMSKNTTSSDTMKILSCDCKLQE